MIGPASDVDLLIFDLGGVLIEWDGIDPLIKLSRNSLTREGARKFWLVSPWVRRFEIGQCSPQSFAQGVVEELDLTVGAGEFLEEFISWDRGPLPGARELLEELGKVFELACLTNNNELHWRRIQDELRFSRYFKYCFVSNQIGFIKPDRGIFEYVLAHVPYPASRTAFFDDNPECVKAAGELGIRAFQARGVAEVRKILTDQGWIRTKRADETAGTPETRE